MEGPEAGGELAMDVEAYLARIHYQAPTEPSLACLTRCARHPVHQAVSRLQAAHQLHIPYENLDVFLGRPKVLEVSEVYRRVVKEGRGGWCCELNGE
jgi:N-hydroxyarylamine O-acetyltransferase